MSFLDTQHKKKSMAITVIIHMILILLLFYVGLSYLDPPPVVDLSKIAQHKIIKVLGSYE